MTSLKAEVVVGGAREHGISDGGCVHARYVGRGGEGDHRCGGIDPAGLGGGVPWEVAGRVLSWRSSFSWESERSYGLSKEESDMLFPLPTARLTRPEALATSDGVPRDNRQYKSQSTNRSALDKHGGVEVVDFELFEEVAAEVDAVRALVPALASHVIGLALSHNKDGDIDLYGQAERGLGRRHTRKIERGRDLRRKYIALGLERVEVDGATDLVPL
ncbi:uncharacterized protein B0I36DRAFT_436757 [Microdochium trichocladiopsis]|uniref:Uncharacterized protein n=1 Tax=Microdochium trichocladiopsis TaxID=1682393 RepID=A0A9P9BKX0_9PEZI|nr:uncharacterized protein B0I36DRAFT_436757 [Microdochium trichocladiopsis]KAH7012093.1 hypothetical protein B0I36DRAFT_436757 [Microdochium trichocladiopsis]